MVEDSRAQKRAIKTSRRNPTEALVEEGLKPAESVVVYPPDALKDGSKVTVTKANQASNRTRLRFAESVQRLIPTQYERSPRALPLRRQQRRKPLEIDIPAADDDADALALEIGAQFARRGEPEAAGRFRR